MSIAQDPKRHRKEHSSGLIIKIRQCLPVACGNLAKQLSLRFLSGL
jgi:hypothetical protein